MPRLDPKARESCLEPGVIRFKLNLIFWTRLRDLTSTTDMRGRLNRFQRAMLDWNELHPYNAVHAVRVPAALDLSRLQEVSRAELEHLGVASLGLDRSRGAYGYGGSAGLGEIKVTAPGDRAGSILAQEIEWQLNTAFPRQKEFSPFRFFVVPEPGAFWFGLVYFHPVADAESVVGLMKRLVEAYREGSVPGPSGPVELYPASPRLQMLRDPGRLAKQIATVPEFVKVIRSSCRPRYRDAQDFRNGFTSFSLGSAALGSLRAAGQSWDVTLNDLFLALLLVSLAPLASARQQARRRKIALGCIVNIRKELGVGSRVFGLFLGSFMVAHEVEGGIGLKELAGDIGRQTGRIKAARLFLGTPMQLAVASLALRFFSTKGKRSFYQKHCPLWGGITNMNLNSLWEQTTPQTPVDYLRAVSTGPVTPLALSVTTVVDRINIGLSYRSTVFSPEDIHQVQSRFVEELARIGNKA